MQGAGWNRLHLESRLVRQDAGEIRLLDLSSDRPALELSRLEPGDRLKLN
jgi:hypothetical protein